MYLKKQFLIFLNLVFVLTLHSSVWAAADTQQPSEKLASASAETTESSEKTDEPTSFCSTNSLLKSDFIRSSIWPGIGPFDMITDKVSSISSDNNSIKFSDPSQNYLTCSITDKQIKACELELHNSVSDSQGVLNLQIGTDFLLEGLGVKPRQIHIVNQELSKKSGLLTGNNYNPVSVIIAPLTVSFQNLGKKEGTNSAVFRVAILNQSGTLEKSTPAESATSTEENKPGEIDAANLQVPTSSKSETSEPEKVESKNEISSTKSSPTISMSPPPAESDKQATEFGTESSKNPQSKPLSATETLKKQFLDLITNWQRIKKTAVRQHQTNELPQTLTGKALVRQTDAIKWLASNHKYYEMLSQGATIERFDPIVQGKKYAVFAEVKEKSKYVDEATKQQLKETDDTYKVNYTVEKIGSHWLITDSILIKQGAKQATKQAGTPSAKSKH